MEKESEDTMKRTLISILTIIAALACGKPTIAAEGEIDTCYLGAAKAETHLDATLKSLANYAKLPRDEKTVAELVADARLAIAGAIGRGVAKAVPAQMYLPTLAAKARLAHADDAVSISENTYHPSIDLIREAMQAIDEAATAPGIDRAAIKQLNGRVAETVKKRLE